MSEKKYKVVKLGVRFSPPILLMIYHDGEKWRQRKMPIRDLSLNSVCSHVAREMKKRHAPYLTAVPTVRLEKLLRLVQEANKLLFQGMMVDKKAAWTEIGAELKMIADKDSNKASSEQLRGQAEFRNDSFEDASVAPGDERLIFDRSHFASGSNQEISSLDTVNGDEQAVDTGGVVKSDDKC